jgi:hypothetical protein
MFRATSAAAVLVCLLSPPLPARDPAPAAALTLAEWAKKSQKRDAYGTYITGKKVGWQTEDWKLGKHDGKDVLVYTVESYTCTLSDGEKSVREEKTVTLYELEGDGPILNAELRRKEDGKVILRKAVRQGKKLRITTKQGARTLTRDVDLPRDTLSNERKLEEWLAGTRKAGETFVKYSVAWEEKDIDEKETYTFKEKKEILWGGVKMKVCVVEAETNGARMQAEVTEDGRVVTGEMGGLLTLRLEKESIAKKLDAAVDLITAASLYVETDLGQARAVDELTLELKGLGDFKIPTSHRQVLEPGKSSALLKLRRDFRIDKAEPLTKEQRERYTRPTPRIQCDHEAIRNQAKKIVGDEKDALKAARKLEAWVFRTLRKSYSDNADTALEVLDHKAGDCTEHSLLFVSLARALGIPAREVGGVAYVRMSKPLFGWHAWGEVHDGHQWVSVDPTWNEVYVDATHVKLSEGSRDLAWFNVAGKIKLKVVKFESRAKPTEKPKSKPKEDE